MASLIDDPDRLERVRERNLNNRIERLARTQADYDKSRAVAAEIAAKIMDLKRSRFQTDYASDNPLTVVDVDIDLHTLRYREQLEEVAKKYATLVAAQRRFEEEV